MQPRVLGSGRFRTSEVLIEDGLGAVWAGSDARTGEAVTVRILHDRLTSEPHRLQQVTGRLRRLQFAPASPHLARLVDHDLRRHGAHQAFAAYEGSGQPLAVRLERSGPLETALALDVVAAVAHGLAAAHSARVAHGALTPASVLVRDDGVVAVIDAGLGELLADQQDRRRGAHRVDSAERESADVLAVAMLLERLTGQAPTTAHADADGPRPWEASVSPEVASVLRQASSPHRRLRPSMAELAAGLAAGGWEPAEAAPTAEPSPAAPIPAPAPRATHAPSAPARRAMPSPTPTARPATRAARPATRAPRPAAAATGTAPPKARPGAPVPAPAPSRRRRIAVVIALVAVVGIVSAIAAALAIGGDEPSGVSPSPAASPTASATTEPSPTPSFVRATVPDTLGLSVDEATALLEDAGLAAGAVTTVPGDAGVVVRSDPTPGEAVVGGTAVDLFVGDGSEV